MPWVPRFSKDKRFHIKVLGQEPRPAYDRVQLTSFFEKESADELLLETAEWYSDNGIELHLGDRVVGIDRKHKTVSTASGRQYAYDHLVLATGSNPFVPPIPFFQDRQVILGKTTYPQVSPDQPFRFPPIMPANFLPHERVPPLPGNRGPKRIPHLPRKLFRSISPLQPVVFLPCKALKQRKRCVSTRTMN